MEKDEQLKKWLLSASEPASPGFAEAVMKKISMGQAPLSNYQPLVSTRWVRLFFVVFVVLVTVILLLCMISTFSNMNIRNWIQGLYADAPEFGKVIVFLIVFWLMFMVNSIMTKRRMMRDER